MRTQWLLRLLLAAVFSTAASSATAQVPGLPAGLGQTALTACGNPIPAPQALPPEGSGPVVYQLELCFSAQGNISTVEGQTYLFYMEIRPSQPSQGIWVPYDLDAEQTMRGDFQRLWATNFLDDLKIEVNDYPFSNGAVGKIVTFHMEERERVKIVNYEGEEVDRAKIEEQLSERGIELRLDSFLDDGVIRQIKTVLRDLMAEEGFTDPVIDHTVTPVAGGPKLVNVTFNVAEGPKIKIRDVEFLGNVAKTDGTLQKKLKDNKPKGLLSFITGTGTYQETKFETDAELVVEYYQNEGYARARVGQPELLVLEDSDSGKERWVELRIPVTEGPRYRVGRFTIAGGTVITTEALRALFEVEEGDWFSMEKVREGMRKAQEIYGIGGYMEFTGFPDLRYRNDGIEPDLGGRVPDALAAIDGDVLLEPTVDVTMRMTEGPQYLVNRIIFTGNTTTRDNVIRREMRLAEGGVFNTESLRYSIRRLNQLGYFEEITEGNPRDMSVDKSEDRENFVDVTLSLRERNRNQLTFGAGVSQYDGLFGQASFQTSNFLGRGESLTVSMQAGDRSQNYQLGFTEPFLFDRNITGGFDVYKRSLQYIGAYTQRSTGLGLVFGVPVADFSRMFFNYSYAQVRMADLNEAFLDSSCIVSASGCSTLSLDDPSSISPAALESIRRNPFIFDSLLIGQGGRRTVSKVTPSFVHNTIDNPIFPNTGRRVTAGLDLAVLGGNTKYYKPTLEAIQYYRHTSRTSFGWRVQAQYISALGATQTLPIFEKLFLGGEYSVRGYDIRSIGPSDPSTGLVLGGNKSLLFNLEYLVRIADPVRLIFFYDAGQVRDEGQRFSWQEDLLGFAPSSFPLLFDPFANVGLTPEQFTGPEVVSIGQTSAFKVSTGMEVRFFMPVLNVPFRLIAAANPQRGGVLDNNLRPAKDFTFKFAVGSTF